MAKRLIVCCDGTWQSEDSSTSASNPTLIARAIKQHGDDGRPQIVYYQKGVGSSLDALQHLPVFSLVKPGGKDVSPFEGAFGLGLENDVQAGYEFLSQNYDPATEDEIYLFGWSRGAYTARSIAGLVSKFGLLGKSGMDSISDVYQAYRKHSFSPDATPEDKKTGDKLKADLKPLTPPIQCVGVWDTVGSLGIPNIEFFGEKIPFLSELNKKYEFHDTDLHPNIRFGFHALALNEHRAPFEPTLWHLPAGSNTVLKQVWFPGVHGSVGGGETDHDLSSIALYWMIQQVRGNHLGLTFDKKYLDTSEYMAVQQKKPWGCADYVDTYTGIFKLAGSEERTPNHYRTPTQGPTNESIHECVSARVNFNMGKPNPWSYPDITGMMSYPLGQWEKELIERYPSQ